MRSRLMMIVLAGVVCATPGLRAQGPLVPPGAPAGTYKTLTEVEPRTHITSLPYTITAPGSYYVTGDLSVAVGNGIDVQANDVTIDLNGFTLRGPGMFAGFGSAIVVQPGQQNVFVRNGILTDWGSHGIDMDGSAYCGVEGVTARFIGGTGFRMGLRGKLFNCFATDCQQGGAHSYGGLIARDCIFANSNYGLEAGSDSIVEASIALSNNGPGFFVDERSIVRDCVSSENVEGFQATVDSELHNCIAYMNFNFGFFIGSRNKIVGGSAIQNSNNGVDADGGNEISGLIATENFGSGIFMRGGNIVDGCTVRNNNGGGIAGDFDEIIRNTKVMDHNFSFGVDLLDFGQIRDCVIHRNQSGVSLGFASSVTGTRITETNGTGIRANGPRLIVSECEVSNFFGAGAPSSIEVIMGEAVIADSFIAGASIGIMGGQSITVRNCDILPDNVGVQAGSSAVVESTRVLSPSECLDLDSESTVRSCHLSSFGSSGVIMTQQGTVEDCSISASITGIEAQEQAEVSRNRIFGPSIGIFVRGGSGVRSNNIEAFFRGVESAGPSIIEANVVRRAQEGIRSRFDGFGIDGSLITGNEIVESQMSIVVDSDCRITGNNINFFFGAGITLNGGGSQVADNTLSPGIGGAAQGIASLGALPGGGNFIVSNTVGIAVGAPYVFLPIDTFGQILVSLGGVIPVADPFANHVY